MSDFNRYGMATCPRPAAKGKRGSALMVVIGFLSFMIVSAVAFSIYMRAERLPSSALRRTVASRQLAKAALAEAISRVDDSLRGSPFPGLIFPADGNSAMYTPRGYPEHWEGRIFMPPRDGGTGNQTEEQGIAARAYYAPASQTVSVPTLEGLGYVPAPLVNDVRFLGRSTYTAKWRNLPYDAGRYAFLAINVSDYFDVNKMRANIPRTSNSDGRISLSYLFDRNVRLWTTSTISPSSIPSPMRVARQVMAQTPSAAMHPTSRCWTSTLHMDRRPARTCSLRSTDGSTTTAVDPLFRCTPAQTISTQRPGSRS